MASDTDRASPKSSIYLPSSQPVRKYLGTWHSNFHRSSSRQLWIYLTDWLTCPQSWPSQCSELRGLMMSSIMSNTPVRYVHSYSDLGINWEMQTKSRRQFYWWWALCKWRRFWQQKDPHLSHYSAASVRPEAAKLWMHMTCMAMLYIVIWYPVLLTWSYIAGHCTSRHYPWYHVLLTDRLEIQPAPQPSRWHHPSSMSTLYVWLACNQYSSQCEMWQRHNQREGFICGHKAAC